jgi:hypothetical protein
MYMKCNVYGWMDVYRERDRKRERETWLAEEVLVG